jgi:hypothetical protein
VRVVARSAARCHHSRDRRLADMVERAALPQALWPGHADSPSAGVEQRSRAAPTTDKLWVMRVGRFGRRPTGTAWTTCTSCPRPAAERVTVVELRVRRRAWCPATPPPSKALRVAGDGHKPVALEQRSLCDPMRSGVKRQAGSLPARGARCRTRHRLKGSVSERQGRLDV